jgi:hypothetical protein
MLKATKEPESSELGEAASNSREGDRTISGRGAHSQPRDVQIAAQVTGPEAPRRWYRYGPVAGAERAPAAASVFALWRGCLHLDSERGGQARDTIRRPRRGSRRDVGRGYSPTPSCAQPSGRFGWPCASHCDPRPSRVRPRVGDRLSRSTRRIASWCQLTGSPRLDLPPLRR